MKSPHSLTLALALSTILVTSFFTYQVYSYYQTPAVVPDQNPTYTLIFPDQRYAISLHDISASNQNLIIPTTDNLTPKITYDQNHGVIESVLSPQDYVLDIEALRQQISLLPHDSLSLVPTYKLQDRYTTSLADFNARLSQVYRTPLNISLKDGSTLTDLVLGPTLLRALIRPISTDLVYPLDLDRLSLLSYITAHLTPKQKKYFNPASAYQNTKNALNLRFMGNETPQVLGVDDGPSSHGELAPKYLEVDLSQQKMYFFIGGTLYKSYKVSTGADYPTPVGEYHILNKEPKAFSSIYNVWMPYWMAFKYASDIKAYLGLHEIAYALDKKGKPVYNHGYYIGDMMTGGCVAMEPIDSREVYNLSDVGMLIRVVK